jgi:hypothetical protein
VGRASLHRCSAEVRQSRLLQPRSPALGLLWVPSHCAGAPAPSGFPPLRSGCHACSRLVPVVATNVTWAFGRLLQSSPPPQVALRAGGSAEGQSLKGPTPKRRG